jgi:hypothetical protein
MSDTYTLYEVAKTINTKLGEMGVDKEIPTQMMYNYAKNESIATVVITDDKGKNVKRVTEEEAIRFIKEYLARVESGSEKRSKLLDLI